MSTDDLEQLRATITALESQRPLLGDAIVETALMPLREKLVGLLRAAPPDEERKRVSVLFADLVGFTAMSETLDPEEVHGIMDAYFGAVTPAITRYQGTVEKYIGDAIMAVFGAPQAIENHEKMAVLAALAMQGALAALNEKLAAERGVRLAIRIGVNTGLVLFGAMGGPAGEDFAVVGDAVNLAARLQVACPVGGGVGQRRGCPAATRLFRFGVAPPTHGPSPRLTLGDRVATIGRSPADSFAALHLLRFSRDLALPLAVTILQPCGCVGHRPLGCGS